MEPSSGVASILTNAGEIENKGIELSLNFNQRFNNGLSWTSNLAFSQNENEVVELVLPEGADFIPGDQARIDGLVFGSYSVLKEGLPVGSIYGYRFEGILQPGQTSDAQPQAQAGCAA